MKARARYLRRLIKRRSTPLGGTASRWRDVTTVHDQFQGYHVYMHVRTGALKRIMFDPQ